jgi:hypothetical protein
VLREVMSRHARGCGRSRPGMDASAS